MPNLKIHSGGLDLVSFIFESAGGIFEELTSFCQFFWQSPNLVKQWVRMLLLNEFVFGP